MNKGRNFTFYAPRDKVFFYIWKTGFGGKQMKTSAEKLVYIVLFMSFLSEFLHMEINFRRDWKLLFMIILLFLL